MGAFSLLAWTGLGLVAWSKATDGWRVSFTRVEDERSAATEANLLEDRVAQLSGDVESLARSIEVNFARLAEEVARVPAAASPAPPEGTPVTPLERPAASAPEPQDEDEGERSFLSFRLPSRDFTFAGTQTFTLLPSLSRVGFDAKSTLHDFSGLAGGVRGSFRVDLAQPAAGITGRVECKAAALGTGLDERDAEMHGLLDIETYAQLAFEPGNFTGVRVDPEAQTLTGTLRGDLTIRDRRGAFALPVRAHVDEARRLVIEGEAPLSLAAFGIEPPSQLGVVKVDDELRLWVHLFARAEAK